MSSLYYKPNYLPRSQLPFLPLANVEKFGTFPSFKETKAITNSKLDAE